MSQINTGGDNPAGLPTIDTITGNSGGAVGPDGSDNINLLGAGGVTVTGVPGTNTLTITVAGGGFTWSDKAISFAASIANGYFVTAVATATFPGAPAEGDIIIINTVTGSNVVIQAAAGQTISVGSGSSSVAGTATSAVTGNSITLAYRTTGLTWRAISVVGSWTLA